MPCLQAQNGTSGLKLYIQQRDTLLEQKQWADVLEKAMTLEKVMPDDFFNRLAIVKAANGLGQYDRAIKVATETMQIKPAVEFFTQRAMAYDHQGNYRKALADYNRLIEINPMIHGAFERRTEVHNHLGEYELAHHDLIAILFDQYVDRAISPDFTQNYAKPFSNSLQIWDKAIAGAVRKNSGDYYGRGTCHFFRAEFSAALADASKAIQINVGFAPAYLLRELCYLRLHKNDESLADARKLIALAPRDFESYTGLDRYYFLSNHYAKCVSDLQAQVARTPTNATLHAAIGRVELALDHTQQAIDEFSAAIKLDQALAVAYGGRGRAHLMRNETAQALSDFTRALMLDPSDNKILRDRAACYVDQFDYRMAIADLSKLIDAKYMLLTMYQQRANCYRKIGQEKLAADDIKTRSKFTSGRAESDDLSSTHH